MRKKTLFLGTIIFTANSFGMHPFFKNLADNILKNSQSYQNFQKQKRIDFRDQRVTKEMLEDRNLTEANFDGCTFDEMSLDYQDLTGTSFVGADLRKVSLVGVILTGANLTNANMAESNLTDADLSMGYLPYGNPPELIDTDFSIGTTFFTLDRYIPTKTNLTSANIENANFKGANAEDAILCGVNGKNANFKGANLRNANLNPTNSSKDNIKKIEKFTCIHRPAQPNNSYHKNPINKRDLLEKILKDHEMNVTILENANLEDANLENVQLFFTNLEGAKCNRSNLENTLLIFANLINTDIKETNFKGSKLGETRLTKTYTLPFRWYEPNPFTLYPHYKPIEFGDKDLLLFYIYHVDELDTESKTKLKLVLVAKGYDDIDKMTTSESN